MNKKILNYIVAASKNGVIGKDNKIPWYYPEDFKYFKQKTMGCPIIMGRKTYDSIGKPLPGRKNIVLTSQEAFIVNGIETTHSFDSALEMAYRDHNNVFVIGGSVLFEGYRDLVDNVYFTLIDEIIDGDVFMPKLDLENKDKWNLISENKAETSDKLKFLIYNRKIL